eukprot:scaffold56948_cov61-Phaeocystis_antarctica.AAC.1
MDGKLLPKYVVCTHHERCPCPVVRWGSLKRSLGTVRTGSRTRTACVATCAAGGSPAQSRRPLRRRWPGSRWSARPPVPAGASRRAARCSRGSRAACSWGRRSG